MVLSIETWMMKWGFMNLPRSVIKFFLRRPRKLTKSSLSIWHFLRSVKSTLKISSVFVAFLENMNFNSREDWFIKNSTKVISVLLLSLVRLFKNQSLEKQRFMMITCQGNFFFSPGITLSRLAAIIYVVELLTLLGWRLVSWAYFQIVLM